MTTEEKARAYDEALDRMKHVVVVPENEKALRALKETIFPELAESEDERIRKALVIMMKVPRKEIFEAQGITKEQALAYLEKQKDLDKMIVVSPDVWDNAINDAYENGKKDSEKQKEHQNNSDAREKALGRYLTFPLDKDKNLDDIAQDYVDGVKEYNPEPTWDLMQTAVCYGYHYCEQKEQKPVVTHGETYHVDTLGTQQVIAGKMPQKPAEWGEDDEKKINFLSRLIEFQVKDDEYCFGDGRLISKQEAIEMLKSFRPQPKQEWSEEDSKRYISIGTTLETSVVLPKEDYDANMAWLRELVNAKKYSGSRPSWKPTKEQMEALESCFCEFGEGCPDEDGLRSLYNDLKKLIYENK